MDFTSVQFLHGKETGTRLSPHRLIIISYLFYYVKSFSKKLGEYCKYRRANIATACDLYFTIHSRRGIINTTVTAAQGRVPPAGMQTIHGGVIAL